jgi:hypothetical protein
MANFDTSEATVASVGQATGLLAALRSLYGQAKSAQALMSRYQANTDPAFNAAINAMFAQAERAELADMLTDVGVLVTDWEANHAGALGLS